MSPADETSPREPFICIAHRGASGYVPENTLESFSKALELGSPWVEFDVRVVEGEPIVFHDHSLARMTGVSGTVEDQKLSYVRSLTVAGRHQIPLLSEALALLKSRAVAQIELKGPGSGAATASLLESELQKGWTPDNILVSSFLEAELRHLHSRLPHIPIAVLGREITAKLISLAQEFQALSLNVNFKSVTPDKVDTAHAAGFKVFAYTVNEKVDIQAMHTYGVDGVFTDFPDRVIKRAFLR
jgi:glycerophosphoryl diester phosphodiesterase